MSEGQDTNLGSTTGWSHQINRATGVDPEDRRSILDQIDVLYQAVEHTSGMIGEVENKLGSVLRPDNTDSSEKTGPSLNRDESAMMGRLRDLEVRIRVNTSRLNDLLIRLEV